MKNRKLRKEVWVVLAAALVLIICIFVGLNKKSDKSDNSASSGNGGGASIIENEGDIEIIIPDDMDSDGF